MRNRCWRSARGLRATTAELRYADAELGLPAYLLAGDQARTDARTRGSFGRPHLDPRRATDAEVGLFELTVDFLHCQGISP